MSDPTLDSGGFLDQINFESFKVDALPSIKPMFESASHILGYNLLKICTEGPQEILNQTKYCQPAVVVSFVRINFKTLQLVLTRLKSLRSHPLRLLRRYMQNLLKLSKTALPLLALALGK